MLKRIASIYTKRPILMGFLTLMIILSGTTLLMLNKMEKDAFALANAGRTGIKVLGQLAKDIQSKDLNNVLTHYDTSYGNPAQGPWQEIIHSQEAEIQYLRWTEGQKEAVNLAKMQEQLGSFLDNLGDLHKAKFKLVGISALNDQSMTLNTVLWVRGKRMQQTLEAKLHFQIDIAKNGNQWLITRQTLEQGETVLGPGSGFVNVTNISGLGDIRLQHNPMFSEGDWKPERFPIARYASAGVSAADYDNDGYDDLFFGNGQAAVLMRNQGDGTFVDTTAAAGLPTDMIAVNTAIFADLDNDGDKDLFLGRFSLENKLFENLGNGTFSEIKDLGDLAIPIVAVASASDYDNDGDLDLYLGRYLDPRTDLPTTPFYTRNGQSNSLLRNDGNFQFTDVTQEAGVDDKGLTLGTTWADYDNDGDQDLYIANDFGRNTFFQNQGDGTFLDITEDNGTIDLGFGMSASWGDANNDGALDLYIANVHSGQRWYGQAATLKNYIATSIKEGTFSQDGHTYFQIYKYLGANWSRAGDHIIRGNTLLLNDGSGNFKDVSVASNTNPFGWYWSSAFFDYDKDGRQDIYSANGWISSVNKDDF